MTENIQESKNNKSAKKDTAEVIIENRQDALRFIFDNAKTDLSPQSNVLLSNLQRLIKEYSSVANQYLILFLYSDTQSISEEMADKIYNAIPSNNKKPIMLILHSKGGEIEPAYLIRRFVKKNRLNLLLQFQGELNLLPH